MIQRTLVVAAFASCLVVADIGIMMRRNPARLLGLN